MRLLIRAGADNSFAFARWVDLLLLIGQHAIAFLRCLRYQMPAAENAWKSVVCDEVIRFHR